MPLGPTRAAACVSAFLFAAEPVADKAPGVFIQSTAEEHLGRCQFGEIINKATIHSWIQVLVQTQVVILLGEHTGFLGTW